MKINFILGMLAVVALSFLNSCKDDETPITGISFEIEEQEVTESNGTFLSFHPDLTDEDEGEEGEGRVIEVKLVFDRPLAGDVVIDFDVDGTASDEPDDDNNASDYAISEEGGGIQVDGDEITILKGATEASFEIIVYEDLYFEYDDEALNDDDVPYETVVLTLESIVSGPGRLGDQLEHTLRILEDDVIAFLQWEAQDMSVDSANADMDILFWLNDELRWGGTREGTAFENVNIPAGLGEGDFGVSYTYYKGLSDTLYFVSGFFTTAGKLDGEWYTEQPLLFEGVYSQANLNEWGQSSPPKISQTMVKSGVNYSNISGLTEFEQGSRIKGNNIRNKIPLKLDRSMLRNVSSLSKTNSLKSGVFKKK